MTAQRKTYSAEFKARVALEALKGYKTVNELASAYSVHPTQIAKWKRHLQSELPQLFATRRDKHDQDHEALQAQLYQQIGQLKVELDWLGNQALSHYCEGKIYHFEHIRSLPGQGRSNRPERLLRQ